MKRREGEAPAARSAARKQGGKPFAKGHDPRRAPGRPQGCRNRATELALDLFNGEAERLARKAVTLALSGDVAALRLVVERLVPPARERRVEIDLPELRGLGDAPAAVAAVLRAVAAGELAPAEGEKLVGLIGGWREATEAAELAQRIERLEALLDGAGGGT